MTPELIARLQLMANNHIMNYIVPGVTSSKIGGAGFGTVRMFEASRSHEEAIVPHSHRFDFQCLVLSGTVRHKVWVPSEDSYADEFFCTQLSYLGKPGEYKREASTKAKFEPIETTYEAGESYGLDYDQIHSVFFSKNTTVLFLEGVEKTQDTLILEPCVYGTLVPTFKVEPWMFNGANT